MKKVQILSKEKKDSCLQMVLFIQELNKKIVLELDQELSTDFDFAEFIDIGVHIIEDLFCNNKIHSIIDDVAKDITLSAYDNELREEAYLRLKKDLSPNEFFLYEDCFLISMSAVNIFHNTLINVQLSYTFCIEDIAMDR